MARQARSQGKRPKERPRQTREEGIEKILKEKGIECKGVRAKARARERWKAVCKPSTLPGRRGSTIYMYIYLTAIGLTLGGSSTVHIYTQTIHRIHRTEHT
jgi:hypothetical protein